MKNIIIFGPQGCGKGVQSEFIEKKYGLKSFSMGQALRDEIEKKSSIGKKVADLLKNGILVPDEVTIEIIKKKSKSKEFSKGIIFDGMPRKEKQWKFLEENFDIAAAIEIRLSDKIAIERVTSRLNCPKCDKIYNKVTLKPKFQWKCDICKIDLIQRNDDKAEEIKKRLKTYHEQTEPLKKFYKQNKIYYEIDGNKPIPEVTKQLTDILDKVLK